MWCSVVWGGVVQGSSVLVWRSVPSLHIPVLFLSCNRQLSKTASIHQETKGLGFSVRSTKYVVPRCYYYLLHYTLQPPCTTPQLLGTTLHSYVRHVLIEEGAHILHHTTLPCTSHYSTLHYTTLGYGCSVVWCGIVVE